MGRVNGRVIRVETGREAEAKIEAERKEEEVEKEKVGIEQEMIENVIIVGRGAT